MWFTDKIHGFEQQIEGLSIRSVAEGDAPTWLYWLSGILIAVCFTFLVCGVFTIGSFLGNCHGKRRVLEKQRRDIVEATVDSTKELSDV